MSDFGTFVVNEVASALQPRYALFYRRQGHRLIYGIFVHEHERDAFELELANRYNCAGDGPLETLAQHRATIPVSMFYEHLFLTTISANASSSADLRCVAGDHYAAVR